MYLVTGASGFIGKRVVKALEKESIPFALVSRKQISGYKTVICDLEFETIPIEILNKIHTIIHLAGFAHDVNENHSNAHLYKSINLDATIHLANQAAESGVKKFIFISSVKASGAPNLEKCMTELDQTKPKDLYGESKYHAELALMKISAKSDMAVTILRPALVYGPNVKGNLSLMMSAIKSGFFPPLPKTNNRRSMVHVDDLIQAIFLVENDIRASGQIYNVTDGIAYSSRDIYESMCRIIDKKIPNWSVPLSLFKIASIVSFGKLSNINKLIEDECYCSKKILSLGFKPRRSIGEMNETFF